jgi:hypothetical protein
MHIDPSKSPCPRLVSHMLNAENGLHSRTNMPCFRAVPCPIQLLRLEIYYSLGSLYWDSFDKLEEVLSNDFL